MFRKKPILTASILKPLEQLRLAIEVFTGKRTCFMEFDFNKGHGKVSLDGVETEVWVDWRGRQDLLSFDLGDFWNTALFDDSGTNVRVSSNQTPNMRKTIAGDFTMCWYGSSSTCRSEVPLFLKEARHCADVRGITLEELLNPE